MVHYSDYHLDSRIQRQARALAGRGDEVHLVCLSEPGEEPVGAGRIVIHHVPCGEKSQGAESAYVKGYARFFAGAARRVTALALRRRLDLVEVHNMPDFLTFTAVGPKLQGTRVILNCHDTFPELFATKYGRAPSHPAVRMIRIEERVSAAIADHVISVTEEARLRLSDRNVGRGHGSVIMNSPDHAVFGPPRAPVTPPADGEVRVLYHGGLAPRFGVETLIRAVALLGDRLPRLTLRVCGSGEDRDRLAALADELAGERIDIARKPVPFNDIPAELEVAHVGVVPTLRDPFTELLLPVKLLEYVHMGLPAVASGLPGIDRYFGDTVRRFEPGSPEALAEALLEVCLRPEAARDRAERAAERLRVLSWEGQRARYLELVDGLARPDRTRARKSEDPRAVPSAVTR
jgi:glycosyltransferase involved in cell wall biosynthesis